MMSTIFRNKGWMPWVAKVALLTVSAAAVLCAKPAYAPSSFAASAPLGPEAPGKAVYLAVTQGLGLTLENRMQTMGNLVAWATRDSIRFGEVVWGCPLGFCSVCYAEFHPLPGIALPGPKPSEPPPFGLAPMRLRAAKVNLYDAEIGIMMPNGIFHHLVAGLPSSYGKVWSITTESRSVALKAGESPRMVAIGGNPGDIFRSGIFVGGTERLLLTAGWNDQDGLGAFAQEPFTSGRPLPEDLIASGGGFFGGSGGSVFQLQYDAPPKMAPTGMLSAVRALDESGAMGDDGWIALKENNAWKAFHLAPGSYRDFRFVRDARGLGVLRYPPTGEPVYTHLRETPTRIGSIETMGGPIETNPPDSARMTLHPGLDSGIKVALADSESNFTALRIHLVDAAGDTLRLGGFIASDTAGGCVGTGICVQPGKPFLEIRSDADSLYATMTVQAGYMDGACFRLISKSDSLWSATVPWKPGSVLAIRAGRSVLELNSGTTGFGRSESGGRPSGSVSGSGPGAASGTGTMDANGRRIPGAHSGASGGAVIRRFQLRP